MRETVTAEMHCYLMMPEMAALMDVSPYSSGVSGMPHQNALP